MSYHTSIKSISYYHLYFFISLKMFVPVFYDANNYKSVTLEHKEEFAELPRPGARRERHKHQRPVMLPCLHSIQTPPLRNYHPWLFSPLISIPSHLCHVESCCDTTMSKEFRHLSERSVNIAATCLIYARFSAL